ncbi:hypothetical protein I4U23_016532 [Adineta vaga]|nr:hypothetical protein I4U23_016532 [Adineta vaga]
MTLLIDIASNVLFFSFCAIIVLGTIGNILNILTFLSKKFRTKPCIFYMIFSYFLDSCFLNLLIITYMTVQYSGYNILQTNRSICKIYSYFSICLPLMGTTCLLLSTFDRCLSTSKSVSWRRLSSMSFAKRLFIITMLFLSISCIFCLIVYDHYDGMCTTIPGPGTIVLVIYGTMFLSLIPHTGILICGVITCIHIRQSRNRINIISAQNHALRIIQKMDRQLFILIFVQGLLEIILGVQRDIAMPYSFFTNSIEKSVERQQIEYLVMQLSTILYTIKFSVSFYINYACSSMFRKIFQQSMKLLMKRCFHFDRRN